jgi:hypothetical protein
MQTALTMVESEQGVSLVPACVRLLGPAGVTFRRLQADKTRLDLVMAAQRGKAVGRSDRLLGIDQETASNHRKAGLADLSSDRHPGLLFLDTFSCTKIEANSRVWNPLMR